MPTGIYKRVKSVSEETKKRISEAHKRRPKPLIAGFWKGRKQSPEHIAKRVAKKTGFKMSEESNTYMGRLRWKKTIC